MELLDIRTIAVIFFVNCLVATLFMAALWQQSRRQFHGISLWLTSFALLTAAFALISLRNVIPDIASILIANTCLVAAAFILYLGLERFIACPSSQRHNYIILAVFVGLFAYFTFFQPDVAIRIVLLNMTLMLMFLQSSWLMLHRVGSQLKPLSRATGIVCLLYAVVACYRIILVIFVPAPGDFLDINLWDATGLLINQILTIGLVLILLLMVNHRALRNILDQEKILIRSKAELEISKQDLTERKRIEAALRYSEERFRDIFNNAIEGIFQATPEGGYQSVNPAFVSMFGFASPEEMKSAVTDIGKQLYVYPEDRKRLITQLGAPGNMVRDFEVQLRRKDGSPFWVSINAHMIQNEKNNSRIIEGTCMDITGRKNAEKEREKSRQELRNLSEHLIILREEERTLLAREIHDELGQALTALKMDLSWLSKKLPEGHVPLSGKIASMLKLVDATTKMVKRLSTELRPGLLDDLGLVAAMEWQAGEFHERTGIKTELSFEPDDIMVDNEQATALFRIFQEVLTNVVRHAAATRIDAYLREKDGALELCVRDNGKGIEQTMINSPKSFGLIGVRERCHYLGGAVDIVGKRGKGTTVRVKIPAGEVRQ